MEHKSREQLRQVAAYRDVRPHTSPMSKAERLERWAQLLDERGDRSLRAFSGIEFWAAAIRHAARCSGSPLEIAFADPVLRDDGLRDDSYGEARRFFELTDWELHYIVCDCHYGARPAGRTVARRVRGAIPRVPGAGMLGRVWRLLAG